jgi:hypothetical protein
MIRYSCFFVQSSHCLLGATLLYMILVLMISILLQKAALKCADFWSRRKLTSPRGTGAAAARAARAFESQPPNCSDGTTPLKYAIDSGKSDVVAYLRSIGAPEEGKGFKKFSLFD